MTNGLWKYLEERMPQEKFFEIAATGSAKAFAVTAVLSFIAFVVLPAVAGWLLQAAGVAKSTIPLDVAVAFWITYLGIAYVFRTWEGPSLADRAGHFIVYSGVAILYFGLMLLSGELIAFGLMILGILAVVAFLGGQMFFTILFTQRDLKKWVEEDKATVAKEVATAQATEHLCPK